MTRPHTAQELYVFARDNPLVMRSLTKSFATLAKFQTAGELDADKGRTLLQRNVKDAAVLYVQYHGLDLKWHKVFAPCERDGCAGLFLRKFDNWYSHNYGELSK